MIIYVTIKKQVKDRGFNLGIGVITKKSLKEVWFEG